MKCLRPSGLRNATHAACKPMVNRPNICKLHAAPAELVKLSLHSAAGAYNSHPIGSHEIKFEFLHHNILSYKRKYDIAI